MSMQFGNLTFEPAPGLPADRLILVDVRVTERPYVILGSGIRGSKLLVPVKLPGSLVGAEVLDIVKTIVA